MNVDHILETMNRREVDYLLIGGMNFFMRHQPVTTFDLDLWIADTSVNLERCERALSDLDAAWGKTEQDWQPVVNHAQGWLAAQGLFCLSSKYGPIDIFRHVLGLPDWQTCRQRAYQGQTGSGVPYHGLSDEDMLACQMALDASMRKLDRVAALQSSISGGPRI